MKVTVTGATGTIGRALVSELRGRGDDVTVLTRDAGRAREALEGAGSAGGTSSAGAGGSSAGALDAVSWPDPKSSPPPLDALRGRDAVVNLLGEPIAQRWTESAKREIRDSRVLATRNLVAALGDLDERPGVLVSQSGVGFYSPQGSQPVDESQPPGHGFEAGLTVAWEAEAQKAEELGMRVACTRTGVVLSPSGGALEKMLPFFKLGIGGPVAGGRQYLSWVHLDDVAGALAFVLDHDISGPVNVTAPAPVTNAEFSKALGRVLHRPAFLPVPAFALKALYGEMGTIVIMGANVLPGKLTETGYAFRQPALEPALRDATG